MDILESNNKLNELATLAASHKLIPFLGAGSSIKHLSTDWDSLGQELAHDIGIAYTNNIEVAENYEKVRGKKNFCEFLKKKLIVDQYSEDKDIAPLIIISLGVGLVYTTNQDNVWDLCAQKYGRPFKKIVTLADLGNSRPGDLLFIKYHGDLDVPESVIFTNTSYDQRIADIDHFLNIRMRSDLLAKNFLFVGYSFRDPNIIKVFEEINAAFRGALPSSFLIAYRYSPEMEELNKKYGIIIIDPVKELGGAFSIEQSFEMFMSALCRRTSSLKLSSEINEMFRPSVPPSHPIVTKYEIEGVEDRIRKAPTGEALLFFRGTFDAVSIPEPFQEKVYNLFLTLAQKCINRELSDQLRGAAFNLNLELKYGIEVLAAVTATAQFRGREQGVLDLFLPVVKRVHDKLRPFCTARAIELLRNWSVTIDDTFRRHVTNWLEGYNELPANAITYIKSQVDYAWAGKTPLEHPFSYWTRLGHKTTFGTRKSFHDIQKDLLSLLPKDLCKPYEE